MIKKLWIVLTRRDKQLLIFLLIFSILISIIETVGITVVMPFISVASDFSLIESNKYYYFIYNLFGFISGANFVIAFGVFLVFFYIFRSAINLLYFYFLGRFSYGRYYLIVYRLFEGYLGLSYREFVKKNSSILTKSIVNEANGLTAIFNSVLFMFSEMFVTVFIYSMMLYVNWKITLVLTLILVLNAILLIKSVSSRIKKVGVLREKMQKSFYEVINRTFGNFKLIKLSSNDEDILNEFGSASYSYAKANITNETLQQFPRLFLEAIGFGLVISIVTYLVYEEQGNISSAMGTLSMFVLGLYRLMPSVNRILTNYNSIMFYHKSLDIVHNDLMYDSEYLGDEIIDFNDSIELKDVSFEYEKDDLVLNRVNLKITKGQKIAFVGESGSGKSTLVDLIIGLYRSKEGSVLVDNTKIVTNNIKSWRNKVGYIPQTVYLFDGTVRDNVIFGSAINEERLIKVLKQARIYDFLQTKKGADTIVGEGGIMLSGGQKQRIAIARALYKEPEILVLDEATSALDNETEEKIMREIYDISEDKTLIIIAHRLSTVQRCEKIYEIKDGTIV